jgi:hypothetical protein
MSFIPSCVPTLCNRLDPNEAKLCRGLTGSFEDVIISSRLIGPSKRRYVWYESLERFLAPGVSL